jgi:hypothetical protein
MRSFKQYLAESVRTYNYKIKIAGEPSDKWLQLFTMNLSKFDPVNIGKPKSTPIQKDPYGFPGLKDQAITIMDVSFRYPCTEPMVLQMAQLLGYDPNMVRLVQRDFNDGIAKEAEMYANQSSHSPLLDHSELEDSVGSESAGKEYSQSYLGRIKQQEAGKEIKNKYSTKETPKAFDPYDQKAIQKSMGNKSPMTQINLPPRPATGDKPAKKK